MMRTRQWNERPTLWGLALLLATSLTPAAEATTRAGDEGGAVLVVDQAPTELQATEVETGDRKGRADADTTHLVRGLPQMLLLSPLVGLGRIDSTLPAGQASQRIHYGAALDLRFAEAGAGLRAAVQGESYQRQYLGSGQELDGSGPQRLTLDENVVRAELAGYVDLLPLLFDDLDLLGLSVSPYAGWQHTHYINAVFPTAVTGPMAGLELSLWPADRVQIEASTDYTFSIGQFFMPGLGLSGPPLGSLRYRAGASLVFAPRVLLSLAYEGEWVAHQRGQLFANSLVTSVAVGLF